MVESGITRPSSMASIWSIDIFIYSPSSPFIIHLLIRTFLILLPIILLVIEKFLIGGAGSFRLYPVPAYTLSVIKPPPICLVEAHEFIVVLLIMNHSNRVFAPINLSTLLQYTIIIPICQEVLVLFLFLNLVHCINLRLHTVSRSISSIIRNATPSANAFTTLYSISGSSRHL